MRVAVHGGAHSVRRGKGCGHAAVTVCTSVLRGRPRGRFRGTTTPWTTSSPPQTPHGSRRSRASERQRARSGHETQRALAASTSAGDSAKNRSGSSVQHGSTVSRSGDASGRSESANTGCHLLVTNVRVLVGAGGPENEEAADPR